MQNERLGKYLREKRKLRYMTLHQLSAMCDISPSHLSRIERAEKSRKEISPSIELLSKLSKALQISLEEVLKVSGYIEIGSRYAYIYTVLEEFLQHPLLKELHTLEIANLNAVEKEEFYESIVCAIACISHKYR